SPESLTTSPNNQFSVNCTARAEVDGQSIPVDIEWTRIDIFSQSGPSELMPTLYTTTGSPERGYQSVLTTSENDTGNTIIYRCTATTLGYSSFSDITILVEAVFSSQSGFFTTSTSAATNIQTISSTFITNPSITPPTQKTISPNTVTTTVFIPGTYMSLSNNYVMMTMSTESQAQSTTKQASGVTTTPTASTATTNAAVNPSITTTNITAATMTPTIMTKSANAP
ncbi:hypothetical protein GBAR_LOCUS7772, partial [Geodia barretti]